MMSLEQAWLALAIGNSRLHWACFHGTTLEFAWDIPHPLPEEIAALVAHQLNFEFCPGMLPECEYSTRCPDLSQPLPLYLASVVPEQIPLWQTYDQTRVITLEQIPLKGIYPTLGIDRALSLWAATQIWGTPVLVIDGGTALTLTGAKADNCLVGGAILPGLQVQLRSLSQATAALPTISELTLLPPRWALNTPDAIRSGVLHTILSGLQEFIQAWWQQFPDSAIALTGGDGQLLYTYLQQRYPALQGRVAIDPHLVLQGIQSIRAYQLG
jgi:type III pantothenate kinase